MSPKRKLVGQLCLINVAFLLALVLCWTYPREWLHDQLLFAQGLVPAEPCIEIDSDETAHTKIIDQGWSDVCVIYFYRGDTVAAQHKQTMELLQGYFSGEMICTVDVSKHVPPEYQYDFDCSKLTPYVQVIKLCRVEDAGHIAGYSARKFVKGPPDFTTLRLLIESYRQMRYCSAAFNAGRRRVPGWDFEGSETTIIKHETGVVSQIRKAGRDREGVYFFYLTGDTHRYAVHIDQFPEISDVKVGDEVTLQYPVYNGTDDSPLVPITDLSITSSK